MGSSTLEALVQQAAAGRSAWKFACRVVATSAITLSGTQTIDSVALAVGDRVLVTAQAAAKDNGIYVVSATAWARAIDMDEDVEVPFGISVYVTSGTANQKTVWNLTSPTTGAITLGSTALTFATSPTSLLGTATAAATPNTLCLRDGSAQCAFSVVTTGVVQSAANSITISAFNGAEAHAKNGTTVRTDVLDPTGANTVTWAQGITSLTDTITQKTTGAGSTRKIEGQQGQAGSVGGNVKIVTGLGGTPGTNLAGDFIVDTGAFVAGVGGNVKFQNAGTDWLSMGISGSCNITSATTMVLTSSGGGVQLVASGGACAIQSGGFQCYAPSHTFYSGSLISYLTLTMGASCNQQFTISCTSCTINQADTTGTAFTGAPMILQAQNSTGAGATVGGKLSLKSGTGNTAGNIELSAGSALKLTVDGSGVLMAQAVRTTKNTATYGTTTTFDLSLGAHQQVTFGAGNITTLTITNQVAEAEYEFTFIQDGVGSRTLTLPAVMKVAGGTFTLSTGPNKRDKIRLRSDGTNLYEVSRSMNM